MIPNDVITDVQMKFCNTLFGFNFSFKDKLDSGSILLTKRTMIGIVDVVLERNGNINGGSGDGWIEGYLSEVHLMSAPSSIEILPSKF